MQVSPTYSNQLKNVSDAVSTGNSMGFVDGNTNPALDDYEYDANGNMVKDRNKGITSITYNYLNLPELIIFENSNSIEYSYNAAGVKLKKTVIEETATPEVRKEVDYLDGFQYAGEVLNFFPTAEGYVRATPTGNITPGAPPTGYAYSYVYNYTDHLGNVRLSYSMDHLTGKLKILEENHYYPFGLRHGVYDTGGRKDFSRNPGDGIEPEPGLPPVLDYVTRMEYQYKYNGKEWQDELGLNFYDYGARNYDPTIGRWNAADPMAPKYFSHSPYAYALNNPVYFIDPDGMQVLNGGEDEVCMNGECPVVELENINITGKVPKKKKEDHRDPIFGYNYDSENLKRNSKELHKAVANYKAAQQIDSFINNTAFTLMTLPVGGVAVRGASVFLKPVVGRYGTIIVESTFSKYVVESAAETAIDYSVQKYATPLKDGEEADPNLINAAVGGFTPKFKIKGIGIDISPITTTISQSMQDSKKGELLPTSSYIMMGATNYMGVGDGAGINASRGNSFGTFIISNSAQSFINNLNNKIIKDASK